MRPNIRPHCTALLVAFAIVCVCVAVIKCDAPPANAQSGGGYDLAWWTVDGGGGRSSGGGFELTGTVGQADAGVQMVGNSYTLVGGFWGSAMAASEGKVYLPLVVRSL